MSYGEIADATRKEDDKHVAKLTSDRFLLTAGGPLQTISTGIIGFVILLCRSRRQAANGLTRIDWLAVFLSLFWLRQVFNPVMSVSAGIRSGGSLFRGDEKKLSDWLGLWEGTFSCSLGAIGLMVALYVIFVVISRSLRLTFIVAGMIGGVLGYVLWMDVVGPSVLP